MAPLIWSTGEVEASVASYFAMLRAELSGIHVNKSEYRRALLPLLAGRSAQAVEFKHANTSAALIELGFPYLRGYLPRFNCQMELRQIVAERLIEDLELARLVSADAAGVARMPELGDILARVCDPPAAVTRRVGIPRAQSGVDYLEIESRNRSIGLAGEEFVLEYERARLTFAGCGTLAARIEHVAKERGDAEGFDILSFEVGGSEIMIEVKTTRYGRETPFFVSRNEVLVSSRCASRYHLYRVFEFRRTPRIFILQGSLARTCELEPSIYKATAGLL